MNNREKLKKLKKMEEGLRRELSDVNQDIRTVNLAICKEEHGIEIGTVVLDQSGKRHKITSIDTSWEKPWLTGNPEKKDGTFGKSERNLYSHWTVE